MYGSKEILKARLIITALYRKAKRLEENNALDYTACELEKIRKPGSDKQYLALLNFLDFLETIAYFCDRDFVSKMDIKELFGNAFDDYKTIFQPWIKYFNSRVGKIKRGYPHSAVPFLVLI